MNCNHVPHAPAAPTLVLVAAFALAACQTSSQTASSDGNGPGASPETESPDERSGTATPTTDIVETAAAHGDLGVLVRVMEETGFADTLREGGPYTLFAPNDAAFNEGLPVGMVDTMLLPENQDRFIQILNFHVVSGLLSAGDVGGRSVPLATLEGGTLDVEAGGDTLVIERGRVVASDIAAANGVIHIIDRVLIPPVRISSAAEPLVRDTASTTER